MYAYIFMCVCLPIYFFHFLWFTVYIVSLPGYCYDIPCYKKKKKKERLFKPIKHILSIMRNAHIGSSFSLDK